MLCFLYHLVSMCTLLHCLYLLPVLFLIFYASFFLLLACTWSSVRCLISLFFCLMIKSYKHPKCLSLHPVTSRTFQGTTHGQ
ncbi:hypothetical protein BGW80DRAFT_1295216 [Lactifluus volemus]|nr:hypothetical protein BGW80DRAFT_1295216 [Lactifluus volemus]